MALHFLHHGDPCRAGATFCANGSGGAARNFPRGHAALGGAGCGEMEQISRTLHRRLARWTTEPEEILVGRRSFAETPPAKLACSVLHAATRPAPRGTPRRLFSLPAEACHFWSSPEADCQTHYLQCDVFREWMRARLGFRSQGGVEEMTSWL